MREEFICMVCAGRADFWLEKIFKEAEVGRASYYKCSECGFVSCRTIAEMPDHDWARVNQRFHDTYQGRDTDPNDPSWQARLGLQAGAIAGLASAGLIPTGLPWLDYGCGDGSLAELLSRDGQRRLVKYEPHMNRSGFAKREDLSEEGFSFVISTSVFEHLRARAQLDEIASLVAPEGVMGVHTLVNEVVPRDPDWFYFLPVHCSFFTNSSMRRLMADWGYRSSVYHPASRLWFLFKSDPDFIERAVEGVNKDQSREDRHYHFKVGFVDFWKLAADQVMRREASPDNSRPGA